MSKNRTIYNIEALYVGPAPDTGFHFINKSGVLVNTPILDGDVLNLIKHIPRVQSVSYSIEQDLTNIQQLGKKSLVNRQRINPPQVNLSFNYLQMGILNESRLGFYANHPKTYPPFNGEPYYDNNFNVFSIGGFVERSDAKEQNELRWPYLYRDKRNIFIAVNNTQEDININRSNYYEIDPNAVNWSVYCFGGCYITSYSCSAGIGLLPSAQVNYTADNITFVISGSGAAIPSVNVENGVQYSGVKFALPTPYDGDVLPSVLLPGDITLDLLCYTSKTGIRALEGATYTDNYQSQLSTIKNIGLDFSDVKIQNYNLDIQFERNEIKNFGYKLPLDKKIVFPVFVNTSLSAFVGDLTSGNVSDLFNDDYDYDLIIKLRNPAGKGESTGTALRYDLLKSKLVSYNFDSSIGSNKIVTFNFVTELDPIDLSKGLFISGLMNTTGVSALPFGNWVTELGDFVVDESSNRVSVGSYTVFF